MGIKASRQYMKQPRNQGGVGEGKQPQQDGGGHASSVADLPKAEAKLVKSEAHASGLTGAVEEAGSRVKSDAHANGLTGAAEEAGRQVSSEAHANGLGHAQEVVPMDAQGVKPEPSACTTGFDQQDQQPSVKRQRVDGGAAVSMPVDGVGAVLFDVAKQCKEEVSRPLTPAGCCPSSVKQQCVNIHSSRASFSLHLARDLHACTAATNPCMEILSR